MDIDKTLAEAIKAFNNGKLPTAETAYKKILKKKKNHLEALHHLSAVYLDLNKLSKANKLIQKAISKNNRKPEFYNIQALILMKQHRYSEAEAALKSAISLNPDPAFLINLATCFKHRKNYADAVKIYNEILDKNPSDSKTHYSLGCVFDELGNVDSSLDSFKAAIKFDPDNKDAQYALGSAYLKKSNGKEALLNLCPVAGHFPTDAGLYHKIGQAWHSLNDYEKAKGAYKRAIDIDPRFAEAYYDLACAELDSKEFVDAIDGFNNFLKFDENNKFALTNLAKAYFSMGEIDEAIRLYNKAATEYASINIATIIPGSPRANHQDILNARRALNNISKTKKKTQNNERLSVGYISSFFHRPNWMKPVWLLLSLLMMIMVRTITVILSWMFPLLFFLAQILEKIR